MSEPMTLKMNRLHPFADVEAMARAIDDHLARDAKQRNGYRLPWDEQPESWRLHTVGVARAAIEAANAILEARRPGQRVNPVRNAIHRASPRSLGDASP